MRTGGRLAPLTLAGLICSMVPTLGVASEFQNSDINPELRTIHFGPDEVGFIGRVPVGAGSVYLVMKRGATVAAEVTQSEYLSVFPESEYKASQCALCASDGTRFSLDSREDPEGYRSTPVALRQGDLRIPLRLDPPSDVTVVERVGDQIWIGTQRSDSHSTYAGEGVVIQALPGGDKVTTLDGVSGRVVGIRRDPIDAFIWITTDSGFYQVRESGQVVASFHCYYTLDSVRKRATIVASSDGDDPRAIERRRVFRR